MSEPERMCVRCNVPFWKVDVPCPEKRPGCAVAHYGWRCPECGGAVYADHAQRTAHEQKSGPLAR